MSSRTMAKIKNWMGALTIMLILSTTVSGALAAGPGITPSIVEKLIFPGDSVTIAKTVTTPEILPNPDIVFLVDTTTSMGPPIAAVQTNLATILNTVLAAQPSAQFAVAFYKDQVDPPPFFKVLQGLTGDTTLVTAGINALTPLSGGGSDAPEDWINGLNQVATGAAGAISFRPDGAAIVVLVGDSSSHDPSNGVTLSAAITALQAAKIRVVAVDVGPIPGQIDDGLNATGQATAVTTATNGVYLQNASPDQVVATILSGLKALKVDVSMQSDCVAPITTTFTPPTQNVTSGQDAAFTETIAVAADAAAGTYTCKDWALVNGQPLKDATGAIIYEQKTIHVPGITLAPATATNELMPGATHTVTATVTAGSFGPVVGTPVVFNILSGPNMGKTATVNTDSAGKAAFTYDATQGEAGLGLDKIQACIAGAMGVKVCANAEKKWQDTTPPTIKVTVDPAMLWPPNHKYHTITATVVAKDLVDPNPVVTLVSVVSSEPDNGLGDGDTINDIVVLDLYHVKVRAERSGTGPGRTYTFTYQAKDASGNAATATAKVFVPHDRGQAIAMGMSPVYLASLDGSSVIFMPSVNH